MVTLSDSLKNQLREELVKQLFLHHQDIVQELMNLEQVHFKNQDDILHWLSKNIWANNVSVKKGRHLRLSAEGRHLFDLLVAQEATTKAVQPIERELVNDHQLWLELNRKCPVPWFVIPNTSINHRMVPMSSPTVFGPKRMQKDRFRVEFYDYGQGSMQLTLMSTIGDLKQWVKFLD